MGRKCANWLASFSEWTLPRSEAPETFIFWTGLFTLASAVRRHIWIPRGYMGSWEAAPNLYVLFIAQAGKARKSTTANYAEDLLDEIPDITKSPELITKESLLSTIVKSNDGSMCIVAPEFGEFIVKSGPEMYGFLTNVYDGKKKISASTLSRGVELAERPCVNLLGATTPEWVAANMPESVIGGGYASRVIFIFEDRVRRRKLFYDDLDFDKLDLIRTDLVEDLAHIAMNLHGEFKLTQAAKDFAEDWYNTTADKYTEGDYKMHGYYERKPAHVLKVAQLVHIAYSDELLLEENDVRIAIKLLDQIEKRLPDTFQAIGKNPYTVDIKRIYMYIKQKGRVSERDLKRQFYHVALPQQLDELLKSLMESGLIALGIDVNRPENDRRLYFIPQQDDSPSPA